MKSNFKKIIALFSAASLLFLGACADKSPITEMDIRNQTVEVAVDDFTAEFIFNDNGLIEKEKKFYNNLEVTYEYYECYEYNENNQIIKRYATDLEGNPLEKHDVFEITYKEDGKIEMISENNTNYVFEYDANGNPVKFTALENSIALSVNNFEYDGNGNKTKDSSVNEKNQVTDTVYTYDENGLVVSKVTTSDGKTTNETNYEYNADGLLTKKTSSGYRDTRTTVYEYKDSILVKETTTVVPSADYPESEETVCITNYEYLGGGNVVKFSREINGELYLTNAYSADEAKGNYADINNIVHF